MLCVYCYVSNKLNKNTVIKKKRNHKVVLKHQAVLAISCSVTSNQLPKRFIYIYYITILYNYYIINVNIFFHPQFGGESFKCHLFQKV